MRCAVEGKVDSIIRELWRSLRDGLENDKDPRHYVGFYVSGYLDALHSVGLLSDDQRELWKYRMTGCPGHDDEGGRSWCAYCGEMDAELSEESLASVRRGLEQSAAGDVRSLGSFSEYLKDEEETK